MLGFKLEMPRREDNVKDKTRPIYLDMQVRFRYSFVEVAFSPRSAGDNPG